ncbi:MAG: hypothetical protein QG639_1033 [Patescibacteria group bacterium]|jgi:hypothetical protein|nr:hypothetical protein [Patescibacteria group bacterium]
MSKPFLSFFRRSDQTPKATFGQQRAEKLSQRLDKALTDRKKLFRAEAAAADPLKTTYATKSHQVERKIDRLTAENLDAKK